MDFSGQHIPYDGELFVFLSGEQMSIPHRHGDILVAHEFLQLHERDLAGLRQPGGKSMPHGMQGDCVQAVTVFRSQSELSDGGLEAGGRFLKRHLFAGLLEDGFHWLAPVRLKHPDHIFRYTDEDTFSPFLNDIKAAGVGIHVLPTQLENPPAHGDFQAAWAGGPFATRARPCRATADDAFRDRPEEP